MQSPADGRATHLPALAREVSDQRHYRPARRQVAQRVRPGLQAVVNPSLEQLVGLGGAAAPRFVEQSAEALDRIAGQPFADGRGTIVEELRNLGRALASIRQQDKVDALRTLADFLARARRSWCCAAVSCI